MREHSGKSKRTLTIAALNAHSLGAEGRLREIRGLLTDLRLDILALDILALNETWQKEEETYEIEGYRYVGKLRKNIEKKRGGGVGFFIAQELRFRIREPMTTPPDNCEMLAMSILLRGQPSIHVVSTYLPPHESLPKGKGKFDPTALARCFPLPRCVFVGDFNAYHKDWSPISEGNSKNAVKRGTAL